MINVWLGLLHPNNNSNTPSDIPIKSSHSQTIKIMQRSAYLSSSLSSSSSPPILHESDPKNKIFALSFGLIFGVPLALFLISFISVIPCFLRKKAQHLPSSDHSSNELNEIPYSTADLELQNNVEFPPPQYESVIQEPAPAYCKDSPPSYNNISEGDNEIVEMMNR